MDPLSTGGSPGIAARIAPPWAWIYNSGLPGPAAAAPPVLRARTPSPVRALRLTAPRPRSLDLVETPDPTCGPDEVLLRVQAASICGTDSHIYDWDPSMRPRIERATDGLARSLTIGHEFFGEVVEGMGTVQELEKRGSRSGKPSEKLWIERATIQVE